MSSPQKESATSTSKDVSKAADSSNTEEDVSGGGASGPSATSNVGDASESSKAPADKSATNSSG